MRTASQGKRNKGVLPRLLLGAVLMLAAQGCEKIFDVRGVLYECGTADRIAGAQGAAIATGQTELATFATDAAGVFVIQLDVPPESEVAATFSKPGYTDLTVIYHGAPTEPAPVEPCLSRAP